MADEDQSLSELDAFNDIVTCLKDICDTLKMVTDALMTGCDQDKMHRISERMREEAKTGRGKLFQGEVEE